MNTWLAADTGKPANPHILYTDGILIHRKSETPLEISMTGTIKTTPTAYALAKGMNFIGTLFPLGATLATTQLHRTLQGSPGLSPGNADTVWIPKQGLTGYDQ